MTQGCTYDAVVIGAGIVGASCTDALAANGLHVAIVERECVGAGATAAGMGHIVVMDDSSAQLALTRYSQQLWEEVKPLLPKAVEFERTGTIWVAADEEEMEEVFRKHRTYGKWGIETEILDSAALEQEEPKLRASLAGGLLVRNDGVLYPPTAAKFLVDRAFAAGAVLIEGTGVRKAGNKCVLLDDGTELRTRWIVNAAGAGACRISPGLPIKARKGHLAITDRYPGFVRHQLVELGYLKSAHSIAGDTVAFNVQPRSTGQLLIGSSRQFGHETPETESGILFAMLTRACWYLPLLRSSSVMRTWTGLRIATPDHLPLIGPLEGDESMMLATGHEGLGITTSLATGQLIADYCLERDSQIPREPYSPSRFVNEATYA